MSGQKPTKNNQARQPSPESNAADEAQQQAFEDSARDEGSRTANREQVREDTVAQKGHPK